MSHQQKLVHIVELPGSIAAGAVAVNTLFHIDDVTQVDSYHVARHEISVEIIGGDPGAGMSWWTTLVTTNGFIFNWAGMNVGLTIRIVAHVFHSICFDISTAQPPY